MSDHSGRRQSILAAAQAVKQGKLIAYPTEAVFGLGCDPMQCDPIDQIISIKGRDISKGLILVAGSQQQLLPYLAPVEASWQAQFNQHWPGPVSFVVPVSGNLPEAVKERLTGGRDTIAVRVSDHPLVIELCRQCDSALVSTSANRSGKAPLREGSEVLREFSGEVSVVVDLPVGDRREPSRIIDIRTGAVLR